MRNVRQKQKGGGRTYDESRTPPDTTSQLSNAARNVIGHGQRYTDDKRSADNTNSWARGPPVDKRNVQRRNADQGHMVAQVLKSVQLAQENLILGLKESLLSLI